jgi:hypothetical protein
MSDSNEETQGDEREAEGLVAIPFSDLAERFGLVPQEDPESGRVFFLWDSMFTRTEDGLPLPNYTVQETAKVFFGRGPDWLRWRYRPANNYPKGYFVLGETILEPKRTEKGNRYYTLADIERMAHALVQNNAIDGEQLSIILQLVLLQARLHRVIKDVPV